MDAILYADYSLLENIIFQFLKINRIIYSLFKINIGSCMGL